MKTLQEINTLYGSDKGEIFGRGHSYLEFYESIFSPIRDNQINLLEIGVLFGNSLKLWSDYFTNGKIYGVEDFSQKDGQSFYNNKPVNGEDVLKNLSTFERIKLLIFNCEDVNHINNYLSDLRFDIIIDDASHALNQQLNNYTNYCKFLKDDGLYICEDVQSIEQSNIITNHIKTINPHKNVEMFEFNLNRTLDDRIILVK